ATPAAFIAGFKYYGYFLLELLRSNIKLSIITLSPSLPIEPGIVKVRTKLKSNMGRLMLANTITLTPGTLSVELADEFIYVHWVKVEATLIVIAAAIAGMAFLLALFRFVKGPSAADRVVAFDVLTIISISGIVLVALVDGRGIYLDVALVYALLSFLGVIVIARYLERNA
ncbi:unnamed protein product, partial [Cyprideis torosa]